MRAAVAALVVVLAVGSAWARELVATESDFACLTEWTAIPGHKTRLFNQNPKRLTRAVRLLKAGKPRRRYPVGTIVQLVPDHPPRRVQVLRRGDGEARRPLQTPRATAGNSSS